MTALALTFNGVTLSPISHKNQTWLTSVELAKALGYAREDSVSRIYDRNKDEFNGNMSKLVDRQFDGLGEFSGLQAKTRIFSLRGCHLIAMFAKTAIAKQFRVWVLDILDKEIGQKPYGLKQQSTRKLDELKAEFEVYYESNNLLTPAQKHHIDSTIAHLATTQACTTEQQLWAEVDSRVLHGRASQFYSRRLFPIFDYVKSNYNDMCRVLRVAPLDDEEIKQQDFYVWLALNHPSVDVPAISGANSDMVMISVEELEALRALPNPAISGELVDDENTFVVRPETKQVFTASEYLQEITDVHKGNPNAPYVVLKKEPLLALKKALADVV